MANFWDGPQAASNVPAALPSGPSGLPNFWDGPAAREGEQGEGPYAAKSQYDQEAPDSPDVDWWNPLSWANYAMGTLKNIAFDIPEALQGLWTIGKATAEDALAGVQQIIPGEQALEQRVERYGYNWGNIIDAAPASIGNDYANRYGLSSLSEMKDQIYHNPLSYVLDALMVSGAAGAAARVGGKIGAIAPSTVEKVAGITPIAEAYGRPLGAARPMLEAVLPRSAVGPEASTLFGSSVAGGATPGMVNVGLAYSPMKRWIQKSVVNGLFTRKASEVRDLYNAGMFKRLGLPEPDANPTLHAQFKERLAFAETYGEGLPVLKPFAEELTGSRAARIIAGISKSDFYGVRNEMIASLKDKFDKYGIDIKSKQPALVRQMMGVDLASFKARLAGQDIPLDGLPDATPQVIEHTAPLLDSPDQAPVVGVDPIRYNTHLATVTNISGPTFKTRHTRGPLDAVGIPRTSFNSPHSLLPSDGVGKAMRYSYLVPDDTSVGAEAAAFAEKAGWRPLGVMDYTQHPEINWQGYHYFFETPEGDITEVNFATREMFEAQELVSAINSDLPGSIGVMTSLQKQEGEILAELLEIYEHDELNRLIGEGGLSKADADKVRDILNLRRLQENVKDNVDAASAMAARVWDHPMRRQHAGGDYDPHWEQVDDLYNWGMRWHILPMKNTWNPKWAMEGIPGPFTTALNRAFMPQKLEALHNLTTKLKHDIAEHIANSGRIKNGDLDWDHITDDILEMLADEQYWAFPRNMVRDALQIWGDRDVTDALYKTLNPDENPDITPQRVETFIRERMLHQDAPATESYRAKGLPNWAHTPEQKAQVVVNRLMENLRMAALKGRVEVGRMKNGRMEYRALEDWSWRTFAEVNPQLPMYYPHIRENSGSAMWFKNATTTKPQMAFNKGFKGYLMESGRYKMNPYEAMSRRAYQLLRHEELLDQFEKLIPMARLLHEEELARIQSGDSTLEGEVLFSPDYIKNKVSLHSLLLDEIWKQVNDEDMSYEEAAKNALEGLNEKLQKTTMDDLANAKVYALPRHVSEQFKSSYLQGFSPARMRMFWDKPRDLWISSVLGLNPRWFIYRMMGNIMFAGINNMADIKRIFSWVGRKNSRLVAEFLNDVDVENGSGTALGGITQGYAASELQRQGVTGLNPGVNRLPSPNAGRRLREWGSAGDKYEFWTQKLDQVYNNKWASGYRFSPARISQFTTKWVNHMEQAERRGIALGAYGRAVGMRWARNLTLARKIADEGIDQGLMNRMADETNWVLGNYTNLSAFERDIVRRFFMPFYPFYRHMVKYTIRMPWDHPAKTAMLANLARIDRDMGPHLPSYMGAAVYLGDIGGMPTYWNITRWNPLAEMALPEAGPLAMIDPRMKILLQAWTGTDDFFKPYASDNVYEAPNGLKMIRTESGWEPFEGREHPPWSELLMGLYGGPGAPIIASQMKGWNYPWYKVAAGQLGVSLSPYDEVENEIRQMEAEDAAFASPIAQEITPY